MSPFSMRSLFSLADGSVKTPNERGKVIQSFLWLTTGKTERIMSVSRNKLTPPQLAERWGISPDKILGWIRRKELRAINAAATMGGRPRYLIDLDDILAFERRREVDALPRQNRRPRKHDKSTTNYF